MSSDEQQVQGSFSTVLWPDEVGGPWGVTCYWSIDGERPECVGLSLWKGAQQGTKSHLSYVPISGSGLERITATAVAELPIATIIERARAKAREHWLAHDATLRSFADAGRITQEFVSTVGAPSEWTSEAAPGRVGAPRRYDRDHYLEVARVYLDAWSTTGDRPTDTVAEHFGVSRSAAAKWVAKARTPELGLLTPARHGVAGAGPGPNYPEGGASDES